MGERLSPYTFAALYGTSKVWDIAPGWALKASDLERA